MLDLRRRRKGCASLALALVLLAPFGPRSVVAGAAAFVGDAAADHEHRVSVRTGGLCADVVLEHDAEPPAASAAGGSHEHREICLSRGASALLSKLSAAVLEGGASVNAALAAPPAPALSASRLGAGELDRAPPGQRALRSVVLLI